MYYCCYYCKCVCKDQRTTSSIICQWWCPTQGMVVFWKGRDGWMPETRCLACLDCLVYCMTKRDLVTKVSQHSWGWHLRLPSSFHIEAGMHMYVHARTRVISCVTGRKGPNLTASFDRPRCLRLAQAKLIPCAQLKESLWHLNFTVCGHESSGLTLIPRYLIWGWTTVS